MIVMDCSALVEILLDTPNGRTFAQASMDLYDAVEAIDEFVPLSHNYVEAFCEGLRLNHPVYDMFYFTLARRTGAVLFTADKPLARLCHQEGVLVLCPGEE